MGARANTQPAGEAEIERDLCTNPCSYFGRDEVLDETPRSFDEHEFVCQAALQQNAYGVVSGQISCLYQPFVFRNPSMIETVGFG